MFLRKDIASLRLEDHFTFNLLTLCGIASNSILKLRYKEIVFNLLLENLIQCRSESKFTVLKS